MDQIEAIADTVGDDSGKTITTMWMNPTTAQHLRKNTEIKALWTGLPEAAQVLRSGGLPPICGVTPVIVRTGYDLAGTYTKLLATNQVVFGPDPVESEALLTECEPVCHDAPPGTRGIHFKVLMPGPQSHINEGITVENEYTFLPTLGAEPDAWWYIANCTAT